MDSHPLSRKLTEKASLDRFSDFGSKCIRDWDSEVANRNALAETNSAKPESGLPFRV
jgi:hypothetical protein